MPFFPNFRCSQLSLFHSAPQVLISGQLTEGSFYVDLVFKRMKTNLQPTLLCKKASSKFFPQCSHSFLAFFPFSPFMSCLSLFLKICGFLWIAWQVLKISLGTVLQEMGQANEALQLLSSAGGASVSSSRALAFLQKGRNSAATPRNTMEHAIAWRNDGQMSNPDIGDADAQSKIMICDY